MFLREHEQRFEEALRSTTPLESLRHLAIALRNEGVSQVDVYFLFERYQKKKSGNDPLYDAIVDTMDEIHGGSWARGGGFFPTALTDEIIRAGRKKA